MKKFKFSKFVPFISENSKSYEQSIGMLQVSIFIRNTMQKSAACLAET